MRTPRIATHGHAHAFGDFNAREPEGLLLRGRRGFLKAGLAGMVGLSLPELLHFRALAAQKGDTTPSQKSVILLWMAGGPSHIDTWDPKPDRPLENRGPFGVTATKLPGVFLCEHLPKQASMLDKFTIIRSVDARHSNHEPNMVFQTGNLEAAPRLNRGGHLYPAFGSVIGKIHGPNHPAMPPYVAMMKSRSHLAWGGYLGKQYDPFIANQAASMPVYTEVGADTGRVSRADLFRLPRTLTIDRIHERRALVKDFDCLRNDLDISGSMEAMDRYGQQAVELVLGCALGKPLISPRKHQQSAIVMAGTSGASRHCWRVG